jgi:hypothetical protein
LPARPEGGTQSKNSNREFYALRLYHFCDRRQQKLFDGFLPEGGLCLPGSVREYPRLGVFTVMVGDASRRCSFVTSQVVRFYLSATEEMMSDSEFQTAERGIHNAPADRSGRISAQRAADESVCGRPQNRIPSGAYAANSRVFELRIYESHSKKANRREIEMFNEGELAIFRRAGLQPVLLR